MSMSMVTGSSVSSALSFSFLSFSSFINATSFRACFPLKPDWIFVAAFETSGSSISISTTTKFSFSTLSQSCFCCSSFNSATSFLACCPLNPDCILVAAFETSGSFISILNSTFNSTLFLS